VASVGSESHLLLDVPRSGSVGSSEGGHAVEERKISEVGVLFNWGNNEFFVRRG
jgi:hypothetical protein